MKLSSKLAFAVVGTGGLACCYFYIYQNPPAALNRYEFKPFPLMNSEGTSPNTSRFRFALPSAHTELGIKACSYVLAKAPGDRVDAKLQGAIKPFYPISRNDDRGYFDLVVKKYEGEPVSEYIHSMKCGDVLEVKGPISKLQYEPNKFKRIGMIAGGVGIAPMMQILHEIANNSEDKTQVDLVYGNPSDKDIILRPELDGLEILNPTVRVHYTVDQASKQWKGRVGPINKEFLKSIKTFPQPDTNCMIYVFGPQKMMETISGPTTENEGQGPLLGVLKDMGYNTSQVYKF